MTDCLRYIFQIWVHIKVESPEVVTHDVVGQMFIGD